MGRVDEKDAELVCSDLNEAPWLKPGYSAILATLEDGSTFTLVCNLTKKQALVAIEAALRAVEKPIVSHKKKRWWNFLGWGT